MKYYHFCFAFTFLFTQPIWAEGLTNNNLNYNFPGGVAELLINKKSDLLPEIKFGVQEPIIIEQENSWRVLIGLDLETVPGEYLLYLKRNTEETSSEHLKFFVQQKSYPFIENSKRKSNIRQTHTTFSKLKYENTQQPGLPLILPAKGQWNTQFGSIHYNQKQKKLITQNQLFLETSNITSVHAPGNALVSNITSDRDGSSTIFLDHGRGLFSIISGITNLSVEIGNGVLNGSVIGKVTPKANYNSPTVSTQLLTWQCILNGSYVNPIILTKI